MIDLLARLVLVLGFCAGTVGAAGFARPVERLAWPLFVGGLLLVLAAGLFLRARSRRRLQAEAGGEHGRAGLAAALARIAAEVDQLAAAAASLDQHALCARVDELLAGPYFDLGGRNDDYARALGPRDFARIWEGFAISERLLARCWSMATDGHLAEGRAELPHAREQIARAAAEAAV